MLLSYFSKALNTSIWGNIILTQNKLCKKITVEKLQETFTIFYNTEVPLHRPKLLSQ
jgi:hypothetical protein